MPFASRLDMCGIGAGHGATEPVFYTVTIDPAPDPFMIAVGADDIGGAAMAIAAGCT